MHFSHGYFGSNQSKMHLITGLSVKLFENLLTIKGRSLCH